MSNDVLDCFIYLKMLCRESFSSAYGVESFHVNNRTVCPKGNVMRLASCVCTVHK